MKESFAKRTIEFFRELELDIKLPYGISVMNPYKEDPGVMKMVEGFYTQYFADNRVRTGLLGINPGRFGGGITGIAFTDPIHLEERCGIPNALDKKHELSSLFIYDLIKAYGGEEKFYRDFYLSSLCPLGFVKDGKNLNYYDERDLQEAVEPFIIETLQEQINLGLQTDTCLCLGEGKNFKFFNQLNKKHHFFGKVIPLSHPRFIMQYRRKREVEFIERFLEVMRASTPLNPGTDY